MTILKGQERDKQVFQALREGRRIGFSTGGGSPAVEKPEPLDPERQD
jgi:hypothetical protein